MEEVFASQMDVVNAFSGVRSGRKLLQLVSRAVVASTKKYQVTPIVIDTNTD